EGGLRCPTGVPADPAPASSPSVVSARVLRILMTSGSREVRYPDWLIISITPRPSRNVQSRHCPLPRSSSSALVCGRLCRIRRRFPSRTYCRPTPPSFSRQSATSTGPPDTLFPLPSPQTLSLAPPVFHR